MHPAMKLCFSAVVAACTPQLPLHPNLTLFPIEPLTLLPSCPPFCPPTNPIPLPFSPCQPYLSCPTFTSTRTSTCVPWRAASAARALTLSRSSTQRLTFTPGAVKGHSHRSRGRRGTEEPIGRCKGTHGHCLGKHVAMADAAAGTCCNSNKANGHPESPFSTLPTAAHAYSSALLPAKCFVVASTQQPPLDTFHTPGIHPHPAICYRLCLS